MSDSHAHDHGIQHGTNADSGTGPAHFTPQEVEEFQKSDRIGGGLIVGLMASIFTIGLLLYTVVLIAVAS
jgi:hypothetical protein